MVPEGACGRVGGQLSNCVMLERCVCDHVEEECGQLCQRLWRYLISWLAVFVN